MKRGTDKDLDAVEQLDRPMGERILVAWIGGSDIRASESADASKMRRGMGPIARALGCRGYGKVYLLKDVKPGVSAKDREQGRQYVAWLRTMGGARSLEAELIEASVSGPTRLDDIYRQARNALDERIVPAHRGARLDFLLSSGTPAMGAVWLLLSSAFGGVPIESSPERSVLDVDLPVPDYERSLLPGLLEQYQAGNIRTGGHRPPVLVSWLGHADRRAPVEHSRAGPVAGFLDCRVRETGHQYRKVVLLYESNAPSGEREQSEAYCHWLSDRLAATGCGTAVKAWPVLLTDKTLMSIYVESQRAVWELRRQDDHPPMDLLLGPGMPHMTIAWMLIATAYYRCALWETWVDKPAKDRMAAVTLPLVH